MSSGSLEDKNPAHVSASNELDERRRAALAEIDNAKFSWFHVKICCVAGTGFFTDAYDIFSVSIVATMLGYVYNHGKTSLGVNQDLGVKVATPIGNLVGQLLFGWLADVLGRKKMYGIELMIIIVATFGQAVSSNGPGVTITGVIVVWRFLLGVGIGGDYPLSSVISSEFASTRTRGRLMTAVFAFQGWGNLASAIVSVVVLAAFKEQIINDTPDLRAVDIVWRLVIGIGIVPACVALYFRLTIPETPRFTMDVERNVVQASEDIENVLAHRDFYVDEAAAANRVEAPRASRRDFARHFSQWSNLKVLIGTAYSWFALDIAFYGLGLNTSKILQTIGFASSSAPGGLGRYQTLHNVAVGNIILAFGGLIPGYWASFLVIDTWGRKPLQLMGFCVLTALFIVMGFGYGALQSSEAAKKAFVFLYCLTNFFQNFGPNTTTFIVPGEAFPTRYRSTAHGISAASGKLGAVVAQVGFARLTALGGKYGYLDHIFEIFALFMLTGIFSTILIPETKGKSLEELSNEDQNNFTRRGVETA